MELSIIEAGYGMFGWVVVLLVTVTMAVIALLTTSRPWKSEFWSTSTVAAIAVIMVTYGGLMLFFLLYFLGYIPD